MIPLIVFVLLGAWKAMEIVLWLGDWAEATTIRYLTGRAYRLRGPKHAGTIEKRS